MSGGDQKASGPDFGKGVDARGIADGAALLGQVDGEAVLVTRRGPEFFAIGATCTHYGGALAEGLFVGDTVRCPLHHACFSLRTGEAVDAPALNPVACFQTEERGGMLYVIGKRAIEKKDARGPRGLASVVVVGAGAAGNAAAELLRREGYTGKLTMIGADPSVPYDRPNLSKDYLAGNAPEEWIPLRSSEFYAENGIDLRLGTRAESIDVAAKTVALAGGSSVGYDALLLATGADPVRLTLPGGDLPHVHYLRTLADSRRIIDACAHAKRAVVVGASFVGLEVAAALRTRGLEVAVVAQEAVPLARIMGEELGVAIRKLHEQHGVVFHLGTKPKAIDARSVALDNGATLSADLVVLGVGVRPAIALAEAAGLAVDRGVLVDSRLRTSSAGVFAAGDIARWPDKRSGQTIRVEHWVVAERQGQCAARNILGHDVAFEAVPFFWSAHYDLTVTYVGHAESWDRVDVAGSVASRDCAVAFRRGGATLAMATIGRDRASLEAEAAMERGDEATLGRIVPIGRA
jgi:NADPH-dependent 2,4-dienoyl-CoA reductase/sulfur reductase-like enzyme/nitrite reductase/ring-hydroxylating ferredoxin subunit